MAHEGVRFVVVVAAAAAAAAAAAIAYALIRRFC